MNNRHLILILCLISIPRNYPMNGTQLLEAPAIESVINFSPMGTEHLTSLALSYSPALVNFGIYNFINTCKQPALIVFGTEAAVWLTLKCSQESDPLTCLSSLITVEHVQALANIAVENIGSGVGYALGEQIAQKSIALAHNNPSRQLAQTAMNTLAVGGIGFYVWSMEPSLSQSLLLSMVSALALTSLTAVSNHPAIRNIQEKLNESLNNISVPIGKVLGVATIASGMAALAYQKSSSQAIMGAISNATKAIVNPNALAGAREMVRANYSWINGYRWTKNMFSKMSY